MEEGAVVSVNEVVSVSVDLFAEEGCGRKIAQDEEFLTVEGVDNEII